MIFLSLVPLITVLIGMCVVSAESNCYEFECADLVEDSLDCDAGWCYEEGGCGCFCCTVCHDHRHAHVVNEYDDSSDSFHAYAKKS
jgi:hypothetical protein